LIAGWLRRLRGNYKLLRVLSYYRRMPQTWDWDRVKAIEIISALADGKEVSK